MTGLFTTKLVDCFNVQKKALDGLAALLQEDPTIGKLLLLMPTGYKNISKISSLSDASIGSALKIKVTIASHSPSGRYNRRFGKKKVYQIFATTQNGDPITLLFFKILPFQISKLATNTTHTIEGKLEESMGQYRMTHPKIVANNENEMEISTKISKSTVEDEALFEDSKQSLDPNSKLEPIYKTNKAISQDTLRKLLEQAMQHVQARLQKESPVYSAINKEGEFKSLFDILIKIHRPETAKNLESAQRAMQTLSALEMLSMRLALKIARKSGTREKNPVLPRNNNISEEIQKRLGFDLTEDQQTAINEIKADQSSSKKMFRLLQGDVGSGKTAVAMMAICHALDAGGKAALMAPTTILAQQHYRFICDMTFGLNINAALLTSASTASERRKIVSALKSNGVDILVGTHSLIQKDKEVKNFNLCVIDEQHRFGVQHRSLLLEQNPTADLLMMTATPIPRTIIMTLFDDIQTSYLRNKPKNRGEIQTSHFSKAKYAELVERLKLEIGNGKKAYWICPAIEESEDEEEAVLASAQERSKDLEQNLGEERILLLHGKMKEKEKDSIMVKFANSKGKILVATTVVEVGMNVPDATIMVIEQAERFGLSQIHQLRGRVGRGEEKSHCILMYSESANESSKKRLSIIKKTNDGFAIAEEDLKLRGSGDIIGTWQSGFENLIIPTPVAGVDFFQKIKEANRFIEEHSDNVEIRESVSLILSLFGYTADIMKLINA